MTRVYRLLWVILPLWACGFPVAAEQATALGTHIPQRELLQQLIEIVVQNNPILSSQASVVQRGSTVTEPRGTSAITGLTVSAGVADYYYSQLQFGFAPTATIGLSVAFADPGRALNILRVTQEKEQAKQQWEKTRTEIVAQLVEKINQMLQLQSKQSSLGDLKKFLDGYTAYVEKQVMQGDAEPDRLLPLKERLASLDVELQDTKNRLGTVRLETAMSLGGKAWEEVLRLLIQLQEFP